MNRREFLKSAGTSAAAIALGGCVNNAAIPGGIDRKNRPNILWIVVEDMSLNWSCFGQSLISTPNIDRLAAEGVMFTNAFVTCPVCSPSRSSIVTGMHQGAIGSHHHRSNYPGSEIQLGNNIKLLPELFKQHGYYTANGGNKKTVYKNDPSGKSKKLGKTDYNFVWDKTVYDDSDWSRRGKDQSFFAQVQLSGGKHRGAKVDTPVNPDDVTLPPYYPDDPVIREDWARYLNSVIYLDKQIGGILQRLDEEGIADNTVVMLWTDHGISHARGKQFLYDEGIGVPLIMRWPGVIKGSTVRGDLVSHIDISATSLYFSGIDVPGYMQGRVLFGPGYFKRDHIYAGRDRCDETLDCIRCVRTSRYKYIRNFYNDRTHLQPNKYKDSKQIIKKLRKLNSQGKLDDVQSMIFAPTRPPEELYDLRKDPWEINNLTVSAGHKKQLQKMRQLLYEDMIVNRDLCLIPETVMEELAANYKSRYAMFDDPAIKKLVIDILVLLEPDENGDYSADIFELSLGDERAAIRWWAARKLGNIKAGRATEALKAGLKDNCAGVRVESARALCLMDMQDIGLPVLINETQNNDQIVRYYAFLAMEDIGDKAAAASDVISNARNDKYEYVKRLTVRLAERFKN